MSTNASPDPPARARSTGRLWTVVLPVLVLAAGALLALALVKTAPKAAARPPQRVARLVETLAVRLEAQPTIVHAFGTVQPAREVVLYPRVAGEVIEINPGLIPGGRFNEGEVLVRIEPRDFELAVRERETDVAAAKASLALEMGQQAVARREYELLGEGIPDENRALVLRQPQLEQAKARLEAAEAALSLARLNLERTAVRAPFNATIRARNANVGMQVATATALATLTGSDEYWIELTVPMDQLRWIRIPRSADEPGSRVRVISSSSFNGGAGREGEVLRLLPDLEPEGRLARLLVSVQDPLAMCSEQAGRPALILGDYVRAEVEGVGLPQAAALDRRLLRDGDRVWLMTPEKRLEIRPVTVAYRGLETVLVTAGLTNGEKVVTTDLPVAVDGMALRTTDEPPAGDAGPTTVAEKGADTSAKP